MYLNHIFTYIGQIQFKMHSMTNNELSVHKWVGFLHSLADVCCELLLNAEGCLPILVVGEGWLDIHFGSQTCSNASSQIFNFQEVSRSVKLVDLGVGLLGKMLGECSIVDEILDFVGFDFRRDREFTLDEPEEM